MMKVITLVFLAVNALALGATQTVELVYDTESVLSFCRPRMLGCAERITVNGRSYLVEALASAKPSLTQIRSALTSRRIYESGQGKVVGFAVRERGHFPNPTVEFDVFKLLDASFPLPQ